MPSVPFWVHQLKDAIEILEKHPSDFVDRRTLAEALGVSRWTAWRILTGCGAQKGPGGALFCRKAELIMQLRDRGARGDYQFEIERRNRVDNYLQKALITASRKQIRLTRTPEEAVQLRNTRFSSLPSGVDLSRTELKIEFVGTEDFLEKVGAIVFAIHNDYETVSAFIESEG